MTGRVLHTQQKAVLAGSPGSFEALRDARGSVDNLQQQLPRLPSPEAVPFVGVTFLLLGFIM